MAIGVVYGEVKPLRFNILLSNPQVEKGSFIKVEHEVYGWGLATIDAITRHLDKNDKEKYWQKPEPSVIGPGEIF